MRWKNGEDFRVGHIHISPDGVAVVSGLDHAGNSIYNVSPFQRMQIVYEISKVISDEPADKKPIGFSQ